MHVSVNPDSPYFSGFRAISRCTVFLDGADVTQDCVEASEEDGLVFLVRRQEDGRPARSGDTVEVCERRGLVRVVLRENACLLTVVSATGEHEVFSVQKAFVGSTMVGATPAGSARACLPGRRYIAVPVSCGASTALKEASIAVLSLPAGVAIAVGRWVPAGEWTANPLGSETGHPGGDTLVCEASFHPCHRNEV